MHIERIDVYHISQPLVSPFTTSFGMQHQRDCMIIAIHSEGLTGWGECVATNDPGYSYETVETAWHIIRDFLAPSLLEGDVPGPEGLPKRFAFVRGHPLAKAGLEQAIWDLAAQREGISLAQKLAQPYAEGPRDRVKVGVSIGIQKSVERTMEVIAEYYSEGYRRIKLKIKPGYDVALATAARANFPDLPIMIDANSAYRLEEAVGVFRQMDDLNLLMIEQPLGYEDIYDHSRLRPQIKSPLCLDESIHSADHTRYAIALGACDIINIKPSRLGGWTESRQVHDLCRAAGMPVWCGGMLETGVGRAAQLAIASLPGFTLPGDISATDRYYKVDITAPFVLNREDSTISVPQGVGLGVEVDIDQLAAVTVRKITIPA